jgi:hypothetical protein
MFKFQRGFLLVLVFFLSACAQAQLATPSSLPPAAIETRVPTVTLESTISSAEVQPEIREHHPPLYELDVVFDYSMHNIDVHEVITYTNNSGDPLGELVLVVEADRSGASFSVSRLTVNDEIQIADFDLSSGILSFQLPQNLEPGETIQVEIDYVLILPAGAGTLSWTDRQTNFIDWYPYVPPYIDDQGWLVHQPAVVGEHSVFESSNFAVHIQVENAPASLEIAAAAPAEQIGNNFTFSLLNARRFAWSASGQYELLTAEFQDIPIFIYFFNEHRDAAEAALRTAQQSLEVFTRFFGDYPYESLSMVDAQFFDGMESDAIFFLDQGYFLEYNYSPHNYLTMLTAHEIAHNWWFGMVGNDQAEEPWLDEALCIYSEMLYYENFYPEMVNWWWEFRIDRFRPSGFVDTSIYNHSTFESYVQAVYMRGAKLVQNIREAIGEESFFAFLRKYSAENAGQIATADDFFTILGDQFASDVEVLKADFFIPQ